MIGDMKIAFGAAAMFTVGFMAQAGRATNLEALKVKSGARFDGSLQNLADAPVVAPFQAQTYNALLSMVDVNHPAVGQPRAVRVAAVDGVEGRWELMEEHRRIRDRSGSFVYPALGAVIGWVIGIVAIGSVIGAVALAVGGAFAGNAVYNRR